MQQMDPFLPGTRIRLSGQSIPDFRTALAGAFAITGGIYLSQIADIVGVSGVTLQNWVKRGFVPSPVNKRYTQRQMARIILIAVLRHALPLDDVVTLLSTINRNLADEGDDLIDDSELYFYFCDLVFSIESCDLWSQSAILARIEQVTAGFEERESGARQTLHAVLLIMVEAYAASLLHERINRQLTNLKQSLPSPLNSQLPD